MNQEMDNETDLESENIQWWLALIFCIAGASYFSFSSISDSILLAQGVRETGKVTSVYLGDESTQIGVTRENGEIVRASTLIPIFRNQAFSVGQTLEMKCLGKKCVLEHPFFLRVAFSFLLFFLGGIIFCCKKIWSLGGRFTTAYGIFFCGSAIMLIRAIWSLIFSPII